MSESPISSSTKEAVRQQFLNESIPAIDSVLFPGNTDFKEMLVQIFLGLHDSFWENFNEDQQMTALMIMDVINEDVLHPELIDGDAEERFLGHLSDLEKIFTGRMRH